MQEFLTRDKLPVIFGILGFILAVLFFTIGFFKTILLILITIIGVALGIYLKNNHVLDDYLKKQLTQSDLDKLFLNEKVNTLTKLGGNKNG